MDWELIGKIALLTFVFLMFVAWSIIMYRWWREDSAWIKEAKADLERRKQERL